MVHQRFLFVFYAILIAFTFPKFAMAELWDQHSILEHSTPNICALTFDDGPVPITAELLDTLKEENVPATFFVLGQNAQRYPELVKRMFDEGHQVENHSFSHPDLRQLSSEKVYEQLRKTNDILQKHGITPRLLRPPYGGYNDEVTAIASELGLSIMLWSVDSRDWEQIPDYGNMQTVNGRSMSEGGVQGVFLFHDIKPRTVRDAKLIITILRLVGCNEFATLSDYFNINKKREFKPIPLDFIKPEFTMYTKYQEKKYVNSCNFEFFPKFKIAFFEGTYSKTSTINDVQSFLDDKDYQLPFFKKS